MEHMKCLMIALSFTALMTAEAQESPLLLQYRSRALAYSHDLKVAEKGLEASLQLVKAAGKELYPKLSGDASFQYTGNPLQLTLQLPSMSDPVTFVGKDLKYGAGLSLQQPIYTGGRLLETIRMAKYRHQVSGYQEEMIRTAVCLHADVQYWSTVAHKEIAAIADDYCQSIASLTRIIRERVEAGMTDRQDLLMMEVKLNEAEYQQKQARKNLDNSLLAFNSLIGSSLDAQPEIEDSVAMPLHGEPGEILSDRPELKIAETQIRMAESERKLTASKYKPQFSVGLDGSYSSPGYDFRSDLDPNYAVYAKMSVPLFEWGKRRNEARAARLKTDIAKEQRQKVADEVHLEVESARISLQQTLMQAELARKSLDKARENEELAIDRYREGKASVIELIDAQTYRQRAQMSYVQAKMAAQQDFALLLKANNAY